MYNIFVGSGSWTKWVRLFKYSLKEAFSKAQRGENRSETVEVKYRECLLQFCSEYILIFAIWKSKRYNTYDCLYGYENWCHMERTRILCIHYTPFINCTTINISSLHTKLHFSPSFTYKSIPNMDPL